MRETVEAAKGSDFEAGYREGKFLVCECYLCTYSDSGEEIVKRVTFLANSEVVKVENSFKGIRFPFVLITANKLAGTIEGLSSVDIGRPHQRLYNELINTHIDGITYECSRRYSARPE